MPGRYGRASGLYNTPTDGISKKVFDRYKDTQVRRYVGLAEEIRQLRKQVKSLAASIRTGTEE